MAQFTWKKGSRDCTDSVYFRENSEAVSSQVSTEWRCEATCSQEWTRELLSPFDLLEILKLLSETPSIYLNEIKQKLYDRFGVNISVPTIFRAIT